jgi:hypothetical protein
MQIRGFSLISHGRCRSFRRTQCPVAKENSDSPPASLEIAENAKKRGRIFATDENQMHADKSKLKLNPLHFISVHRSSSVANIYFSAFSAISSEAGGG